MERVNVEVVVLNLYTHRLSNHADSVGASLALKLAESAA